MTSYLAYLICPTAHGDITYLFSLAEPFAGGRGAYKQQYKVPANVGARGNHSGKNGCIN